MAKETTASMIIHTSANHLRLTEEGDSMRKRMMVTSQIALHSVNALTAERLTEGRCSAQLLRY
jgi:hypothetical protein